MATANSYLGQNDTLCKHRVAVAIRAVTGGKPLSDEDKRQVSQITCSGKLGELSKKELSEIKKELTTVGGFIEETVQMLKKYAKLDPPCIKAFEELKGKETCFGWEEPLLKLIEN